MKKISIMTPCYNEEENVYELYTRVKDIFKNLNYHYEHLFIDNCSTDKTVSILEDIASKDRNIKIIVNSRNFGHLRSPWHGLLQTTGDAAIIMSADFQEPPEMIPDFIKKWEEGYKMVFARKTKSKENKLMYFMRRSFYKLIKKISEVELLESVTGFGLYDRDIIEIFKKLKEPYPYGRGIICEIGYEKAIIDFTQPKRERGKTKNNFYTLYDMAMLGIVSHSKLPLRIATLFGFILGLLSFIIAFVYLILKLLYWDIFNAGTVPILLGIFFFSAVQLLFLGLLGEYVGILLTRVTDRPHVFEKKRVNFDEEANTEMKNE
jgi:glycosyltransferase involved in cell wall biosynthesis